MKDNKSSDIDGHIRNLPRRENDFKKTERIGNFISSKRSDSGVSLLGLYGVFIVNFSSISD